MAYLNNMKKRNSIGYRFTIDNLNDPALANIRRMVKAENKLARWRLERGYGGKIFRVRVMPRGPRRKIAKANSLRDFGTTWTSRYDAYLPMEYGTHFDIYVSGV